jgi:hypothetical protein
MWQLMWQLFSSLYWWLSLSPIKSAKTFESEVLRHYDALILNLFLKDYQNKNKLCD